MLKKSFGILQQVGKALMLPVAILPAAGLLLGLGHENVLGISIMEQAGSIIFANLPLLFAIGVAIGLANGEGVAGLAATIGYLIMNVTLGIMANVPNDLTIISQNPSYALILGIPTLQTGVFGGIIVGITAALLYKKFYSIELPPFLGFFAGKRFIPIITAATSLIIGVVLKFLWPPIQLTLNELSYLVLNQNTAIAAFVFGLIERSLIPFGLHHIFYSPFWFEFGTYKTAIGEIVRGDVARFFAGDPSAGTFMSGKFPFMMFGLPAAALAMYQLAKPHKKKIVAGIMASAALTSFLTGITEPIEFTFLFVAPFLYAIHCVFAGLSFMIMDLLKVKAGMTFSGGFIDYLLYWNLSRNSILIIPVGIGFALVYYFMFRFAIIKWNIKTPGREDEDIEENEIVSKDMLAKKILDALGGKNNISNLDACITRLRISVNDIKNVDKGSLKKLGASGVLEIGNNIQAIFGPRSDQLKTQIKNIINDDNVEVEEINIKQNNKKKDLFEAEFISPIEGVILELDKVPDEVFSKKLVGDGFAIEPTDGLVVSPVDGQISSIFPSKHAIGIQGKDGHEILIHFGIDTVNLKGEGFESFIEQGQNIKAGDKLIKVDIEKIKDKVPSLITPIIFTNLENEKIIFKPNTSVKIKESHIIDIKKD